MDFGKLITGQLAPGLAPQIPLVLRTFCRRQLLARWLELQLLEHGSSRSRAASRSDDTRREVIDWIRRSRLTLIMPGGRGWSIWLLLWLWSIICRGAVIGSVRDSARAQHSRFRQRIFPWPGELRAAAAVRPFSCCSSSACSLSSPRSFCSWSSSWHRRRCRSNWSLGRSWDSGC